MIDTDRIINLARACLGTPFVHQGRVPGVGLDCAGLLVHVLHELGLPYIDELGYGRHPYRGQIKAILDGQPCLLELPRGQRQPGDVLLIRFKTEPQHVAFFTGSTMVHAYSGSGRAVEHGIPPEWEHRIVTAYRIVGPADER